MDRHSVNFTDTSGQFLLLKPRLLKCTMPAIENMLTKPEELRAEQLYSAGERESWRGY